MASAPLLLEHREHAPRHHEAAEDVHRGQGDGEEAEELARRCCPTGRWPGSRPPRSPRRWRWSRPSAANAAPASRSTPRSSRRSRPSGRWSAGRGRARRRRQRAPRPRRAGAPARRASAARSDSVAASLAICWGVMIGAPQAARDGWDHGAAAGQRDALHDLVVLGAASAASRPCPRRWSGRSAGCAHTAPRRRRRCAPASCD